MSDKHADRLCTLDVATRGGAVLSVPGITVTKAEEYSAMLFQTGDPFNNTPVALFGSEGLVRLKVYPSELIGTSITVAEERRVRRGNVLEQEDGSYVADGSDPQIPLGTPVGADGTPLYNGDGSFS